MLNAGRIALCIKKYSGKTSFTYAAVMLVAIHKKGKGIGQLTAYSKTICEIIIVKEVGRPGSQVGLITGKLHGVKKCFNYEAAIGAAGRWPKKGKPRAGGAHKALGNRATKPAACQGKLPKERRSCHKTITPAASWNFNFLRHRTKGGIRPGSNRSACLVRVFFGAGR